LHGCTQTSSDFAAGTRFDSVAERAGAYVVYPEQSVLHNPNRCWNWFLEENQHRDRGEPREILDLVGSVLERYPIDRRRVYVAGLSAGGAMAAILAEQAPDLFAAVGIMAGVALHASHDLASARAAMHGVAGYTHPFPLVPVAGANYARMRATIWTGGSDRTVNPSNASELARQFLQLFGMSDPRVERTDAPDMTIERWYDAGDVVRVEAVSVRGMGHAWSGGSFRGSHTHPSGPRASDAMMTFFLRDRNVPA
jgi:poly(hydroxyalkanoate) depolymerase family esterase